MKKILVVDNDKLIVEFMNNVLSERGHKVVTAEGGLAAVDILKTYTPDIIFIDLVMPNIDGKKLCKIIRAMPELKDVAIVILSAIAAEENINIKELKANACIAKGPFKEMTKHIVETVDELGLTPLSGLLGETIGVPGIYSRNITKELLSIKDHFQTILGKISEGVLEITSEGRIVYANSIALSIIEIPEERLLSFHFIDLFADDDRHRVAELMKPSGDKPQITTEEFPLLLNGHQVTLQFPPIDGYATSLVIINDITERLQAEEELRESEEKFRQLADLLPQTVFETDERGNLTFANRIAFDLFGYTSGDFEKGLNALNMLVPEDRDRALENIARVLKGEWMSGTEYTALTKDDDLFPVIIHTSPIIREDKPVGLRGIITDLTKIKEAEGALRESEEKLARSRKMEAMGLMAGGVAHDLNNILSGIVSYPELLLLDIPEDSPMWKPIKTIQESGMRAADVVEDLLTIARGVATGKEALNLNTLVTEYLSSAEHEKLEKIHSFVDFKTELDPDLLNMSGSATHIKKILMNLVANASEAIEDSGTVAISTANQYLDEPLKGYEDVHIGEYTVLSVSDDGSGISPEDLERIFEPFYTKKVMGRSGTGLGLAVVWNTVQDHNGYINVKSSEKGTEFELYFPVTREEVAGVEEKVPMEDYLGHGEKILVIDS